MAFTFSPLPEEIRDRLSLEDTVHVPIEKRIYTTQDLRMSDIGLVGFDMDYTLAVYRKEPMEQLQYDMTVDCLIRDFGYPEEIRTLEYCAADVTRGLTIDKRYGHLFKMDAAGRVTRCYHGHEPLTAEEIKALYRKSIIKISTSDFSSLDTLFALPEASLYLNLVDYFQQRFDVGLSIAPLTLPLHHETPNQTRLNTWKLATDVRQAIDTIHKDDSLKSRLMANLNDYIEVDEKLPLTLHKMRSAGKRLFLLTNSHWPYTDALMSHLLNDRLAAYPTWRRYFDYVIVGGRKPVFFTDRDPFLELDISDPKKVRSSVFDGDKLDREKVYQAGNMQSFERMTGYSAGEILYVGDHIFGDIMRSRKDSKWRTCLIVEELEEELRRHQDVTLEISTVKELDTRRHDLDDAIAGERARLAQLELALTDPAVLKDEQLEEILRQSIKTLKFEIDEAKRTLRKLDSDVQECQTQIESAFNKRWGMLCTEHNELSRFGAEISRYACIYTSRVTNLLSYSPMHYFRAPRVLMSHDYVLANSEGVSNMRRTEQSLVPTDVSS